LTKLTPVPADSEPAAVAFTPAPLRPRRDGWTADKQIAFIAALAQTACVHEACRRVAMSDSSAYALRMRPIGRHFRAAWDAALDYAMHRLEQAALSRALHGVPRPVFYKGEQIGEWREYDERLTMFLLRYRRPCRFGGWIDGERPADGSECRDEAAIELDGHVDAIGWLGETEAYDEEDGDESPPA
jgi:hypothetical protein